MECSLAALPFSEAEAAVYITFDIHGAKDSIRGSHLLSSFHSIAGSQNINVPDCSIEERKYLSFSSLSHLPKDPFS